MSARTIYTWREQELIDTGQRASLSSSDHAELVAARHRIAELETELAVTKRAAELLKHEVSPKGGARPSQRSPRKANPCRLNAIADGLADLMEHLSERDDEDLRCDIRELRLAVGLEERGEPRVLWSTDHDDFTPSDERPPAPPE